MDINQMVQQGDAASLAEHMREFGLTIQDGRIVPKNDEAKKACSEKSKFFDGRQQARKILLNSLYGALLNEGMRMSDERMGQSVTLSGRSIVRHMGAKINEIIDGTYDHLGNAVYYQDTDSVAGDSLVETENGQIAISDLFNSCPIKWNVGDKEYGSDSRVRVLTGSAPGDATCKNMLYVYRHRTNKRRFRVTTLSGNSVIVTEDHSVMIRLADGSLVERKPVDIKKGDQVLLLNTSTRVSEYTNGKEEI